MQPLDAVVFDEPGYLPFLKSGGAVRLSSEPQEIAAITSTVSSFNSGVNVRFVVIVIFSPDK